MTASNATQLRDRAQQVRNGQSAPPPDGRSSHVGTAASRARQARRAVRRRSYGRVSMTGPSGSGKTWTALETATVLAQGRPIVLIDTEFESAELYADHFTFDTIPWEPPYDPRDLAATVRELADGDYRDGVIVIDSASHFWRGQGGTLDIADGRFGGWKTATPAQDDLVEAILRAPAHVIACTRAKQTYEVEENEVNGRTRQSVRKLGLAPVQRDDLEYEFTVVAVLDMEHRIDIGKTRCPDLAGKSFQANHQREFAQVFAEWLTGGEPLARQADLDAIRETLKAVDQPERRRDLAEQLVVRFGPSDRLTEEQGAAALAWLSEQVGDNSKAEAESTDVVGDDTEPAGVTP